MSRPMTLPKIRQPAADMTLMPLEALPLMTLPGPMMLFSPTTSMPKAPFGAAMPSLWPIRQRLTMLSFPAIRMPLPLKFRMVSPSITLSLETRCSPMTPGPSASVPSNTTPKAVVIVGRRLCRSRREGPRPAGSHCPAADPG